MSTGQYQNPYRTGYREKRGCLEVLREKIGAFEIWETIPPVLPDGSVMLKLGEEIKLDEGTYEVVDVTECGALCESRIRKTVEYKTDGGREVKFTATKKGTIRVSPYRPRRSVRRRKTSRGVLRGLEKSE